MAGFVVGCLVRWPIGCLMASCPKYSTTCSPSLPAADKLLLLLLASDFGKTLLPANRTSLILQTAFHQSPINPAIFLWWWALWTVFEVFVWFDLFSSAKNQRQQRPASTKLRTTTSHTRTCKWLVLGALISWLDSCVQQPAAASPMPDRSPTWTCSLFNWDDGLSWYAGWLVGGWARLASATRALLQPHPPSHPPFVIHSVWHLVFPRTWNQGLSHIAETRKIKKSKKHSFQSVM